MSLRDLVSANDCAEPNPLARFVNGFSNEKMGMTGDQWIDQRDSSSDAGPSRTAFDRLRQRELQGREINEEELFNNIDRDARHFDPLDDDGLELSYRNAFQRPNQVGAADGPLGHLLKAFVLGNHTKEPLGRGMLDMGLSNFDKAKIRDRASVMSRHIYDEPGFVEDQMNSLMNNLRIGPDDRMQEMESVWRQARFDRGPPPPSHLEREREMERHRGLGGDWANEFNATRSSRGGWADEFASERAVNMQPPNMQWEDEYDHYMRETQQTKAWIEENSHHGPLISGEDAWANKNEGRGWAQEYTNRPDRLSEEEEMEAAWKTVGEDRQLEEAWGQATGADYSKQRSLRELTDAITRIDDPKLQRSSFMQFMHKINRGQVAFSDDNTVIENEGAQSDDWASEYSGLERQFSADNDWAREYDDFKTQFSGGDWAREYDGFTGSITDAALLEEYHFALNQASNPYTGQDDVFEQGVELFKQGMITESILALEAEVQRNPTNSKAWQFLGQAHAENDKDNQAITCLARAVEEDPQNLEALAALAVSYTNDFNREKALEVLEIWLKRHPDYTRIPESTPRPPPPSSNDFYIDAWSRHTHVANMYLEAARQRPEDPDPEVQTALGLLYNLSYEYDKAVDCFQAALTKRPEDYLLWNKLGATLANSNRSEEALGAYYKALEGKPTYVRARANLGISFLALNEYPDAARSFLAALRLHPNAAHLWDNLKMVFRLMSREDLEERAMNHNIDDFGDDYSKLF